MFNWCFIGAGNLAGKVAEELLPSGRHRIASVYTRRWESCADFAARYGAAACKTAEEAISRPEVDGVYVVTPHNSHYEYAKLSLELGKPVFVEKSFTVSARETDALIDLASERKLYICEAMWTWFNEPARQALKWVREGDIGEPQSAKLTYRYHASPERPRHLDPARAGGAILDIGVYPITYVYRLFGEPESVACRGVLRDGVDISEDIELTFAGGVRAELSVSIADEKHEELRITGSAGTIFARDYHYSREITLERADGSRETFSADSGGYLPEFDAVAHDIRAGKLESALVPHKATSDVMRILDECREQMGLRFAFETDD